ncbi:MAG TPA: TolC family protein [Elusimicrobiota bacterium]|nr:TolC family protein [Elusimicrobiota bacterium]
MRRGLLFLLSATLAWPAAAGSEEPYRLTLLQARELAAKQNIDVALAEYDLERFDSLYHEVIGSAFPSIDLTGTYTRSFKQSVIFFGGNAIKIGEKNAASATVGATQPLYTGGKVSKAIAAAHQARRAQEAALRGVRDEVDLAVVRLFYAVLLARDIVAIQKENLDSAQRHYDTIRARYNQGLDSDLVLRRQEVEVANAKTLLISADNMLETARLNLKDVLSLDIDRPLEAEGAFDPVGQAPPENAVLEKWAMSHRPEVLAVRSNTAVARSYVSIAAASYKPTLDAFANYQWTAQSADKHLDPGEDAESVNGGLTLKFNLFQGGQSWQKVRQAKIDHEKARLVQEKTERAVRREVQEKWLAVREAAARVKAQETAVEQARRALEATEVRYREGDSGQLELTDATFAFNRARLQFAEATHDYWVNIAALERAVGTNLKEVQP